MTNTIPSIYQAETALHEPFVAVSMGVLVPPSSDGGADGGTKCPLDLIEGHLTDNSPHFQAGRGFEQGYCAGHLVKGWGFREGFALPDDGFAQVLTMQPFRNGGYEASLRPLNLPRIGRAIEFGGCRGKREEKEQSHKDIVRTGARAKKKVRHLVKNMAATHLVTLTRRESDPETFWTPEDWAKAWDKFRRSIERVIGDFPYVAILEQHKKGNFHLHVAWCGRVNLNIVRPVWWACNGGRGAGNVDVKHIKVRAGLERSSRIASYISKYVTKMFNDHGRFNKKRYWASKQTMEDVRRYVLRAASLVDAISEIKDLFGVDFSKFSAFRNGKLEMDHLFMFPDGTGLWFNFLPELHGSDPPF